ncbi:MAG: sulfurtransferase TusA family protein [Deltaproteobacteria bacterium]|nr:sulfurtransferase TusA family protein [Deltaproteobacteria bacterium]
MTPSGRLDIRPFACPLTWVKTRIALEGLRQGEVLEVLLADGEPLENVPRSAALEGHAVLSREPAPGGWRLLLRKGQVRHAPAPSWEA